MTNKLQINTNVNNDITILKVSGEIDLYTVNDFQKAFSDKINKGINNLVIDFLDVTYLDSSGLSALLSMHKKVASLNGSLSIVTLPDKHSITRIFEITRLNTVLNMFHSLDDAIDHNTKRSKV